MRLHGGQTLLAAEHNALARPLLSHTDGEVLVPQCCGCCGPQRRVRTEQLVKQVCEAVVPAARSRRDLMKGSGSRRGAAQRQLVQYAAKAVHIGASCR